LVVKGDKWVNKKILFIASGLLNTGGIEKYNQNLLKAILESGYSVKIISRNDIEDRFSNVPLISYGYIKYNLIKKIIFSLRILWEAFLYHPDIIICGHINFSPLCYMISRFINIKYIVLTHGIDVWHVDNKLKIEGLKEACLIATVSNFTKNKIIKQIPEVKNKIKLLPNTIDDSIFYPKPKPIYLLKRHSLKKENKIILTVARLKKTEKYKGYYKILDILPDIVREIPEIKYILVGSGNDLENIQKYIKEKNLEKMVILTGHVPDNKIADYYNLCDIFVMPSKKEGFGIVFLEALACGKPVIAGDKDGSVDAVLNGKLGTLVNPDNLEEIAKSIINFFSGKLPNGFYDSKYLRTTVLKHYKLEVFHKKVVELLEYL